MVSVRGEDPEVSHVIVSGVTVGVMDDVSRLEREAGRAHNRSRDALALAPFGVRRGRNLGHDVTQIALRRGVLAALVQHATAAGTRTQRSRLVDPDARPREVVTDGRLGAAVALRELRERPAVLPQREDFIVPYLPHALTFYHAW